ncbi:MAG: hypothetical protein HVN35_05840 [Methanobacteriaceae archaeon]|nr:hypothetical protein [Methanobacteriaceae archaeon]
MATEIILIKILATVGFLVALVYSLLNYQATKFASGIWLLLSLAMGIAFILSLIRTVKEFVVMNELEVVKICLIPVVITLLLAASLELKRSILKPL